MKKIIIVLIVTALVLALASCSKEDSKPCYDVVQTYSVTSTGTGRTTYYVMYKVGNQIIRESVSYEAIREAGLSKKYCK